MTILCATDFSRESELACDVAARIAAKAVERLVVVHVADRDAREADVALQAACERLQRTYGEVEGRLETGAIDSAIASLADSLGARLIVVAAGTAADRPRIGRTTDHVISMSSSPILVVRDGFPVVAWLRGDRPLRVGMAVDLSPISDRAASWAATLTRYGAVEFRAIHVEWPAEAYERVGIEGPMPLDRTHPAVGEVIRREIERAAKLLDADVRNVRIDVAAPSDQPASTISRVASEHGYDLLIIGHRPHRTWRVWEGSVARAVIRSASMSVVCVPDVDVITPVDARPPRCIVAATDLSPDGNAAVAHAFAIAPPHASVFIAHVLYAADHDPADRQRIMDGLASIMLRRDLVERRIEARVELLTGDQPAEAIAAYCDRVNADLVCIAARGSSRLPRIMLGSVAQELLLRLQRPLLIVP